MMTRIFLVPHALVCDPMNPFSSAYESAKELNLKPAWEAEGDWSDVWEIRTLLKEYRETYGLKFSIDRLMSDGMYLKYDESSLAAVFITDVTHQHLFKPPTNH